MFLSYSENTSTSRVSKLHPFAWIQSEAVIAFLHMHSISQAANGDIDLACCSQVTAISKILAECGVRTWVDTDVFPGQIIDVERINGIENSKWFIALLTTDYVKQISLTNKVFKEFNYACQIRPDNTVAVLLDEEAADKSTWHGLLRSNLGAKSFVDLSKINVIDHSCLASLVSVVKTYDNAKEVAGKKQLSRVDVMLCLCFSFRWLFLTIATLMMMHR